MTPAEQGQERRIYLCTRCEHTNLEWGDECEACGAPTEIFVPAADKQATREWANQRLREEAAHADRQTKKLQAAEADKRVLVEALRTDLNAISHFLRVAIPSERDRQEIEGLAEARRSIRAALETVSGEEARAIKCSYEENRWEGTSPGSEGGER